MQELAKLSSPLGFSTNKSAILTSLFQGQRRSGMVKMVFPSPQFSKKIVQIRFEKINVDLKI